MSAPGSKQFPLMQLSTKLRLMVYERLPRQIKHTKVSIDGFNAILITRHLPTALLRTSKQVHSEALPIVENLIREFTEDSPTHIIEFGKSGSKTRQCKVLEYLMTQIPFERTAVEDDERYDIQAILQRLPESTRLQAVDPTKTPNVARFLHQAARAKYRPGECFHDSVGGIWNNTAVTVFFTSSPFRNEQDFKCICENNRRQIRHMNDHRTMAMFPNDIWIAYGGVVQVGGGKSLESAVDRVPMFCQDGYDEWGKKMGDAEGSWGQAMSQEDWNGEWLPS